MFYPTLKGKNALVCGSSKGIGKASALLLSKGGANVTLLARSEDALKATLSLLDTSLGQNHDYLVADFGDQAALSEKISALAAQKHIHILVNNTGGPPGGPIANAQPQEFISAFNNHLICNHIITQALIGGMKQEGFGRIINVISTSVKQPLEGLGVSNTIRAAVANWAKTLSNELARYGITVNNVLPGATMTDRLESILQNKAAKMNVAEEEVKKEMLAEIPAARFATAEEIGAAVAFLATPEAAYITGINIPVDGGRTKSL